METQQFKELSGKLDRIATLLALTVVRGLRPEEQVSLLSSAGFQPSEIARLISTQEEIKASKPCVQCT